MDQNKGASPVDTLTTEDLEKALDRHRELVKDHITLKVDPILEKLSDHDIILTGKTKVNGLVGTMNKVIVRQYVIYGFLSFLTILCTTLIVRSFFS